MRQRPPAKRDINNLADLRVGLYCRVSLDENNDGKSVGDQQEVGLEWVERVGAILADTYIEEGSRSASRFATKEREEFTRLLADIKAGKLDIIWFWELSRSQRKLSVFADLRDLCRDMGVLWVIRDRVYNPSAYADMITLGMLSVIGENESEMTSERVLRGKASSARAGRRAGKVPYGYRAVYDSDGHYLHDVPDMFDGDGQPVEDSPAYVVREIYARILAGHSINSIRRDLDDRGVRTRAGYPWASSKIRNIATSPTYIGMRVHQVGQDARQSDRVTTVLEGVETKWPALVDAETFWAVHRLLSDPARNTTRPGRALHLLSSLVRCAECGAKLIRKNQQPTKSRPHRTHMYFCSDRSCVGISAPLLDDYVEKVMMRWLSDPGVVADLTRVDNSTAATQARADAEQLRGELATLYRDTKAGGVSPKMASLAEAGLLERIDEAEQRIQAATLPAVLRGNVGPQATAGWHALDMSVKRQIIRAVADIRLCKVGRHGNQPVPADVRVTWRWLLGADDAGQDLSGRKAAIEAHRAREVAQRAERRAKVAHLHDVGWTRQMIAEELKVSPHTVKKDMATAREQDG